MGVCSVAAANASCADGFTMSPDNATCIKCAAGQNITSFNPVTCTAPCNGTLVDGTCYLKCQDAAVLKGAPPAWSCLGLLAPSELLPAT